LGRDRYGEVLHLHQALLREVFAANRGEEVDTQGDAFFVAFRSAADAVAAAVGIQRALAEEEWPEGAEVRVRIGIHTGEAAAAGERYVGFSVHRAARIGAAAHGGQVLLSSTTCNLVEDDLPEGVSLRDLGLVRLKDIERPELLAQLVAEGLPSEFPPLRGAEVVKPPPAWVLRRRSLLLAMLAGVIAAAVAIPVFALGGGGGGGPVVLARVPADAVGSLDAAGQGAAARLGTSLGGIAEGFHSLWVSSPGSNSIYRVNESTMARTQTIPVGNDPQGIAVGGGFVWVANSGDGTVSKIDPNEGGGSRVDTIQAGNGAGSVAYGFGALWVANATDSTVQEFKPGSHRPKQEIPVPLGADAIAIDADYVWVVSESGDTVTGIDPHSGTVLPSINVGSSPDAVAVGDGSVWVADYLDNTVDRINPRTDQKIPISVGQGPNGIAVGSDGSVWVSNELSADLTQIDPARNALGQTIRLRNPPTSVAPAPQGTYVTTGVPRGAHRGGTLTVLLPGTPYPWFAFCVRKGPPCRTITWRDAIDPASSDNFGPSFPTSLTNDGLVAYRQVGGTEGLRVIPDLARALPVPTDGGRTYTFQLRPGIKYSNGALVRPADFRRAIERTLANPGNFGTFLTDIRGAAACAKKPLHCDLRRGIVADASSNSVTFHLTKPDPVFLDKLAFTNTAAVPADTPVDAHLPLPATGPYMVVHFDKHELRVGRNPYFHEWSPAAQPDGYPDEIVWKFGPPSQQAQIRMVKSERADIAWGLGTSTAAQLTALRQQGFGGQLHVNPGLNTEWLLPNTRIPPFDDSRVREALNYAVDRNRFAQLMGGPDFVRPTCQVLPPAIVSYRRYCPYTVHPDLTGAYTGPDLAKAQRLVAASGTRGESVTIWTWSSPLWVERGDYLDSVLTSLGYKAHLKTVANIFGPLGDRRQRRHIQAAVGAGFQADYPSPVDWFPLLVACAPPAGLSQNALKTCVPSLDAKMKRAEAEQASDPQAAATLWSEIDRDVVDQALLVPLFNFQQVDFVSHRVGNYEYNPKSGVLFDQIWVR
jgi:ABC-type transport system substrate-binding protein/streptogramin lyase